MGNTAYTSDKLLNNLKVPKNLKIKMANAGELINGNKSMSKNLSSLFKNRNKKIHFVRLACHLMKYLN